MFDFRQYFLLITAFCFDCFFENRYLSAAPSRNLSCGGSAALPRKDQAAVWLAFNRFPQQLRMSAGRSPDLDIGP